METRKKSSLLIEEDEENRSVRVRTEISPVDEGEYGCDITVSLKDPVERQIELGQTIAEVMTSANNGLSNITFKTLIGCLKTQLYNRNKKRGHKVKGERVVLQEWHYSLGINSDLMKILDICVDTCATLNEYNMPQSVGFVNKVMGERALRLQKETFISVCIARDEHGRFFRGVAIRNTKDHMCEHQGRNIARGRAYQAWHHRDSAKSANEMISCQPEVDVLRLCGAPEWLYKSQADPCLTEYEKEALAKKDEQSK